MVYRYVLACRWGKLTVVDVDCRAGGVVPMVVGSIKVHDGWIGGELVSLILYCSCMRSSE